MRRPKARSAGTRELTEETVEPMPREVRVIALVAFIVALGFGIVGPAIPLLAESFGVGKATAASAISAFALLRLASALVNGKLVDAYGERRVLAVGLFLQAVTTTLAGLSPTFLLVVVFRSLGGFGSAAFTVAAMSLLLKMAPPGSRGRAVSVYQGGFLLGAIVGPGLGGLLAEVSPRVPFVVYGVALLAASVVGLALLKSTGRQTETTCSDIENLPLLAEHSEEGLAQAPGLAASPEAEERPRTGERFAVRAYVACLAVNLGIGWLLYGVRNSLMPVYVVEELDHSAAWAGVAFLIGSAAQAIVLWRVGPLVDLYGRRPMMVIGGVIGTAAAAALILPPSAPLFLGVMVALGAAGAMLASAPAAVLADIVRGSSGRLVAAFQMAADLGGVVGPLAAGAITDAWSYQAAFGASAVVMALGLALSLVMPETSDRRARALAYSPEARVTRTG